MNLSNYMNKTIQALPRLLFIAVVVLLCYIVLVAFLDLDGSEWNVDISTAGILGIEQFWLRHAELITLFGCVLTLWIACYNLKKYMDVETVNALATLRSMLNSEEKKKIHTYLMEYDEQQAIFPNLESKQGEQKIALSNVELFDYLGTIELGAIMLQRGVISFDEFYNQFGYRVENIKENKALMECIKDDHDYYEMLLYVIGMLNKNSKTTSK